MHICTCAYVCTVYVCVCIYAYKYVCICSLLIILEDTLKHSTSSLVLEVNNFLQYVKEKFSEVLLPINVITKQGLVGKG